VHNIAPYRVVQWTTGNVGKSSVGAIAKNPNYELIGCYAWSKNKADRDVGELVGIEPLGIKATNDVDALLANPTSSSTTRCGSTSTSWCESCRQA
jgi:hypothetical protein